MSKVARRKWHSPTDTGAYESWRAMRSRCIRPTDKSYQHYGAKGVNVCPTWIDDFDQFYADMGDRPKGYTLDRKDNALGYSAENCQWATRAEQVKNRRSTVVITYNGYTRTLSEWAEVLGVPYFLLWNRIQLHKMPIEKALRGERLISQAWVHGSLRGYERGCRCALCKEKRSNWYAEYKKKKAQDVCAP